MSKARTLAASSLGRGVACLLVSAVAAVATWSACAQGRPGPAGTGAGELPKYANRSEALLAVPVTGIRPGALPAPEDVQNPFGHDPGAVERGMKDFIAFNCVGCHAPNGAGGMGPALSNGKWLHGSSAANIYLSIYQGRSNGMPAWGGTLPSNVIWELVSYLQSISQAPDQQFGHTISLAPRSPAIEQVPAQDIETATPWKYTQPINSGHKP